MSSRRGFIQRVFGLLAASLFHTTRGGVAQEITAEIPGETVQDLIDQIRILEMEFGNWVHIRAIEDQIRVRLLMVGMVCIYRDKRQNKHFCLLHTRTGELFTLPVTHLRTPAAREGLVQIGLGGLDSHMIPNAWQI